jgi:uncharacterized protein
MSDLTTRQLLIDLSQPPGRHWCANDAFLTAWFNALSMSFPLGEQFFIDSLLAAVKELPQAEQHELQPLIRGFVAQEATHRHVHKRFNDHLLAAGLSNGWERRIVRRLRLVNKLAPKHRVAITAAYEHFTAVLSAYLLRHPQQLAGTEERLQHLWLWHASEEVEHKSVAFDLFQHIDGRLAVRRRWMARVTLIFFLDAVLQTLSNLRRDGSLYKLSTWRSAWRFLLGPSGVLRESYQLWKDYFRADFHPNQHSEAGQDAWLQEHPQAYRAVRAS